MLSKMINVSLARAFCTINTTVARSTLGSNLAERSKTSETELTGTTGTSLQDLASVVSSERKHLAYYANEIKQELNDRVGINFQTEKADKTLIFESVPDGTSNSKLGEVLLLGSGIGLWNLLLGFPSYLSVVGVLGAGGLGAVWSYSNYLRRTSPRITQIYKTNSGLIEIHYIKPSGLFSCTETSFSVQPNKFSHTSFSSGLANYLRKSNQTSWVKVDGQLFWYSSNPQSLRINNHHWESLI